MIFHPDISTSLDIFYFLVHLLWQASYPPTSLASACVCALSFFPMCFLLVCLFLCRLFLCLCLRLVFLPCLVLPSSPSLSPFAGRNSLCSLPLFAFSCQCCPPFSACLVRLLPVFVIPGAKPHGRVKTLLSPVPSFHSVSALKVRPCLSVYVRRAVGLSARLACFFGLLLLRKGVEGGGLSCAVTRISV
jgi:hypothetical protein